MTEFLIATLPLHGRTDLQDQRRARLNGRAVCGPDCGCIRNPYVERIKTLEAEVAPIARGGRY